MSAPHAAQGEPSWEQLMTMLDAFSRCGIRSVGLTVPETTDLLYMLSGEEGWDVPIDALSVEESAQGIRNALDA